MPLVLHLEVYNLEEAALHKQPYALQWNVTGTTHEQFLAAGKLLEMLSKKMTEHAALRAVSNQDSDQGGEDGDS